MCWKQTLHRIIGKWVEIPCGPAAVKEEFCARSKSCGTSLCDRFMVMREGCAECGSLSQKTCLSDVVIGAAEHSFL